MSISRIAVSSTSCSKINSSGVSAFLKSSSTPHLRATKPLSRKARSLTQVALNDFFRDALGEPPLTIEEKRRLFYEAYAATISPEDWRLMDREDILRLALPGDEPHLLGGPVECFTWGVALHQRQSFNYSKAGLKPLPP
jgi:hypothetical protein